MLLPILASDILEMWLRQGGRADVRVLEFRANITGVTTTPTPEVRVGVHLDAEDIP
jgi:hypothetical protein